MKEKADVNAQDGYYGNALQVVVFTGDNKSAEILIKAGADVNALGGDYGNILQAVAFTGDNKSAEILIKEAQM